MGTGKQVRKNDHGLLTGRQVQFAPGERPKTVNLIQSQIDAEVSVNNAVVEGNINRQEVVRLRGQADMTAAVSV
jgi:hypothetical protein